MNNYLMINVKNNSLLGVALKDFDILMNEVNFFEKLLQEPKEKQENIVKKIMISEMNNFDNTYTFDNENSLKNYLQNDDNALIFDTNDKTLFYLNKNINQKQALNEQIMIELKTNLKGEKNVKTNDDKIRSDARRIGKQFAYGIRNPQDDDSVFQDEISGGSSQIGYSNNKFDTRAPQLSSQNDRDDQRRDKITKIDQPLVIKQIARRLSSIYQMTDINDDLRIHYLISERSKLVSEYILSNEKHKKLFKEFCPKDIQELLEFSTNQDYNVFCEALNRFKENYLESLEKFKIYQNILKNEFSKIKDSKFSLLEAINFKDDNSILSKTNNIQNNQGIKTQQIILEEKNNKNNTISKPRKMK
ncbi:hypothetical protein JF116_09700 [Campylobacter fetus subsp. venerealis]|uniref:hypothetical protein n=1 Tax=Campylobacter fetus TaxID=196 RepID=UPI0019096911|nr:hypothetical protein [Campylobacter fetus]MBK3487654.1 hypothetical protein [Campylobacter fetus subsp. venerealis]